MSSSVFVIKKTQISYFQIGSKYRSCSIISSVSELARGELYSIVPRLTSCAIEKIIDMAVCCILRVSDRPSAPDYLILIGDTFRKTKVNIVNK